MRHAYLKFVFATNVLLMCFLFYLNCSLTVPIIFHKAKQLGVNFFPAVTSRISAVWKAPKPCVKRIVLFGIRQHWFQFCEENPPYKHLIQFPRKFSCHNLDCSVFLNYSVQPRDIRNNDIVIFTNVYQWMTSDMWDWVHGNRSLGQRWVMLSTESPLNSFGFQPPIKYADVTYDWLGSYKSDSDFYMPYGYYEAFSNDYPPKVTDLTSFVINKSKSVAWIISNCDSLRMQFVQDLQQFVQVDTYGECGETQMTWGDSEELQDILKQYYFYLSFENSCCDEYITAKFWRTLDVGAVPVVMGPSVEQYAKVMPRQSFIHVDEFSSMEDLAKHLVGLQLQTKEYLKYFKWRNLGKVVAISQNEQYIRPLTNATHCDIVEKFLQSDPAHQRKLEYFGSQWLGSCKNCSLKFQVGAAHHV